MDVLEKLKNRLIAQLGQIVKGIVKSHISAIRKWPEEYDGPPIENEPDRTWCLLVFLSQDPPQGKVVPEKYDRYKVFVVRQRGRAVFTPAGQPR